MSEEKTIVINDEKYNFGDLKVETQAHIARVAEIRREIAALHNRLQNVTCYYKPIPKALPKVFRQ